MKRFENNRKSVIKSLYCVALTGALILATFSGCGSNDSGDAKKNKWDDEKIEEAVSDSEENFSEDSKEVKKKTAEIEKYIDNLYYFDTDDEKREESYYDGIMAGLDDRYSVYYTKEEYEKIKEDDSGAFDGIGATVSKDLDNGTIYIVKPIEDSPAEKAGLLPGDVILRVGDLELTTDMELEYVVQHIRGEKGTDQKNVV